MKKYHIRENSSTPSLPFKLYRYEVGEMMNVLRPQEQYLKFTVEGHLGVDTMDSDDNFSAWSAFWLSKVYLSKPDGALKQSNKAAINEKYWR